jgi:hypothetical protein
MKAKNYIPAKGNVGLPLPRVKIAKVWAKI